MIVIKVELVSAITGNTTELGRAIIANDGTGDGKRNNYDIKVARKGTTDNKKLWQSPLRKGRVENYPSAAYNVWRLIIRALKEAFPEEK